MIADRLGLGPSLGGESPKPMRTESRLKNDDSIEMESKSNDREFNKVMKDMDESAPKDADPTKKQLSVKEVDVPEKRKDEFFVNPRVAKPMTERQKAMLKFMDSMESEFNVPPEEIVEAIANLKPSDQLKAPEETASQVISQLDLAPEDEGRAQALYVGMLQNLPKIDAAPQAMWGTARDAALMQQNSDGLKMPLTPLEKRAALNESLDRLNGRFFVGASSSLAVPIQKRTDAPLDPKMIENNRFAEEMGSQIPIEGFKKSSEISPSSYNELAKKLSDAGMSSAAIHEALKRASLNKEQPIQGGEVAIDATGSAALAAPMMAPNEMQEQMMSQDKGFFSQQDSERKSKGDQGDFKLDSKMMALPQMGSADGLKNLKEAAFFAPAMTAKQEVSANIQQVMNQAQYMIKKGGGEASVKLYPEGMGQVHLRIMVEDGKVNLQMSTDNKEAKRMLEGSIADLKSNLETHKLSIDSVKVDVGHQSSSDLKQDQRQADFRQDQSRDQARQFLQNFRDNNASSRGGGGQFWEMPGLKGYANKRQPDPLTPEPVRSSSKRYASEGKGSGLDLVA